MVEVYSVPLMKRFFAPRCSIAYIIQAFFVILLIVAPFFVGYISSSFWKTEEGILEQPSLLYKHKLVLQLEGKDADGLPMLIFWSSEAEANSMVGPPFVRLPIVKTMMRDTNLDGLGDEFFLDIKVPLYSGESINRMTILAFFEVTCQRQARFVMEGMATFKGETALPSHKFATNGELVFHQQEALPLGGVRRIYEPSLFDSSTIASINDVRLQTILEDYAARNESLVYEPYYRDFESVSQGEANINRYFEADIQARVRPQTIMYIPSPAEALKFAWIQYLAIFVACYWARALFMGILFTERVVETRMLLDTKPPRDQMLW